MRGLLGQFAQDLPILQTTRRNTAVWLKAMTCKYDLYMRVHRSNLNHPNWLLSDNIKRFTCLIRHLHEFCAVWGSETADSPLELSLQWSETQRADCDCLPLLLFWLELLDHEITGPDVKGRIRSQRHNLISLSLQYEHTYDWATK